MKYLLQLWQACGIISVSQVSARVLGGGRVHKQKRKEGFPGWGNDLVMDTVILIFEIALLVIGVFLVAAVLMQQGKAHGLSGAIAGGADTFFGKEKGKDMNKKLSIATTVVGVVFVLAVLVLYILMPDAKYSTAYSNNNWTISPFQSSEVSTLQKTDSSTDSAS